MAGVVDQIEQYEQRGKKDPSGTSTGRKVIILL